MKMADLNQNAMDNYATETIKTWKQAERLKGMSKPAELDGNKQNNNDCSNKQNKTEHDDNDDWEDGSGDGATAEKDSERGWGRTQTSRYVFGKKIIGQSLLGRTIFKFEFDLGKLWFV